MPAPNGNRDASFVIVDMDVIRDSSLSPSAKAVYAAICANVDSGTRSSFIKVSSIVRDAGCSRRTAQESLKALKDRGVIEYEPRYSGEAQIESFYRGIGHRARCYANGGPP